MLDNLISFSISLLIGLLIGIERERSHEEGTQPIGVRTFILLALLGTTTAILNQPIITLTASTFAFGIILISYFRSTYTSIKSSIKPPLGITTEISAAIMFCLGYITPTSHWLAIIISGIVLLVLLEKQRLHTLARKKLKTNEIRAAIILIIFSIGIIPVLPNQTIDPWGLFNPQKLGLLMATIAGLQFGGYIAIRLFGERFGIALTGFLGGLISSTAVFANFPNLIKSQPNFMLSVIAAGILATVAMLLEVMLIIFLASPILFLNTVWPILGMIIMGCIFSVLLLYKQNQKFSEKTELNNPLNFFSILRISLFIGITLIVIALTKQYLGVRATLFIAFLGGLFEIHGITLATALLFSGKKIQLANASLLIYIALLASFVSKFFLLWTFATRPVATYTSLFLIGMLASGGIIYWSCL